MIWHKNHNLPESKMTKTISQLARDPYFIQFRESYYTQFSVPSYLQSRLTLYKRSVWSASYFLKCWEANIGKITAGTLPKYNGLFHIQFCSGCSISAIKTLLALEPTLQITLSFRQADNMPDLVLVDFQRATS